MLTAQTNPGKVKRQVGIIMGNVLDAKSGKALGFASVDLSRAADTTKKIHATADKNGSFEFTGLSFGYYRLSIDAVGFRKTNLDSIHLRAERYDFNLGDIKLNDAAVALDEIVVYAEKPLIENKDDKITYNVGESALSSGSSASELLKNMPLVNNDPDGKILLKGKEPKILIDDKPTDLTAQQLQDLLESMPGSSIEKIEIMTSPPPQYATETGGVINIVTKKGRIGWMGKVTASAGTRNEGSFAGNASYRNKQWSFNVNAGEVSSTVTGNNYSRRQNMYKDSSNYLYTTGDYKNKNQRPNFRFQADYDLNKRNIFNFSYQGNLNIYDNVSHTTYENLNRAKKLYKASHRTNGSDGTGYNHGINISYTHRGKNPAAFVRFIASGNIGKNNNDLNYFQQFLNPNYRPTGIDSTQAQLFDTYNRSGSIRFDYHKPLRSNGDNFSTGATFQQYDSHNSLNTSFLRKSDSVFVPNELLSNDFWLRQGIFTVRAGFSFLFPGQIRFSAGAQAEHTHTMFNFVKGNIADITNNYWNVLPNITIRKEFNRMLNTSLTYRSTIRRPGIGEMNPNITYSDPYNIRFGNPYLQPSLSDNFNWMLGWIKGKYYINTSIGYNKVRDVINSIRTLAGGGKTQTTWLNIADRQEYDASIFGGLTVSRMFRINGSIVYTYNQYSDKEKKMYRYRDGGTFLASINYTFTPSNVLNFEGNARFNNFADPQGRSRSSLNMNLGVQRKFFDRRLVVSMNVIDPFTTQEYTTYTYGPNFNIESINSSHSRNYRVTVSYQLNKVVQKSVMSDKQKQTMLDKLKKK